MRRIPIAAITLLLVGAVMFNAEARKQPVKKPIRYTVPIPEPLPADLRDFAPLRTAAVADTTHLGWWGFDGPGGGDPQGWTSRDITVGLEGVAFHVADGTELSGGDSGNLLPLQGAQSMWCGAAAPVGEPFCSYASLPGYGNNWKQLLCSDALVCDSVRIYYDVFWDSEPGYDRSFVEYFDENASLWQQLPVDGGSGYYEGEGTAVECLAFAVPSGQTQIRFRFKSDGAFSDEDGLFPTDGAIVVDSITVQCFNGGVLSSTNFEDFEGASPGDKQVGIWTAKQPDGFGDFAALYPGVNVLQNESDCTFNRSYLWGFFDDPMVTNYACGGFPQQGAIPYGPDANGLYLKNAVESPLIAYVDSGDKVLLSYDLYTDNTLDQLLIKFWEVRSWVNGCPTPWTNTGFIIFFENEGWRRTVESIGQFIDPSADFIQIRLGVFDNCGVWCGIFGSGDCHSHAPLYDNVHLSRVNQIGPEIIVRHYDLFQDNFAEDGTLTGSARADMAQDIAPSNSPTILPGDSICMTATNVGVDPNTGVGPSAYVYVAVWPPNQLGKAPAELEAPEARPGVGTRFPLVGTVMHDGVTWACFRMDSALTSAGAVVDDKYCFDLNDTVFTPGDTICYVLAADDGAGNTNYWSRRLDGQGDNFVTDDLAEALSSPLEFQILPSTSWNVGDNILFVDDADDRSGPPQLFLDTAFEAATGLRIDRYDVLGPSSAVSNGLASRVKNIATQITDCYQVIIWGSGNLSSALIGDGTGNPEKSDDYGLLYEFLDTGDDDPGVYLNGDDIAEEWTTLSGAGAINLRASYMNFNLVSGDHVGTGESVSPLLTATGPCFFELGVPNKLIAFGGCPLINDFDVLQTTGLSVTQFPYPNGSGDAVISQATPNSNGSTARVVLSGFSYHYIRDIDPGFLPVRMTHLRNVLNCLGHNAGPIPTGIPDVVTGDYLTNAAPNPFNPTTTIRYGVRERGHVTLKVYNVAGQLVRTLVNEVRTPRPEGFEVTWDGRGDGGDAVASGVYFYKLTSKGFVQTKKMVLLK